MKLSRITIIGVGLIGGSFAKALKAKGHEAHFVGFGPDEQALKKAVSLGAVDSYSLDMAEAVKNADMVVLSVPLGAIKSVLTNLKPYLSHETIITDVASAKSSVLQVVKDVFGHIPVHFVAGHPIAGKEKSGVEAACENLFVNHRVILTPVEDTSEEALSTVRTVWQQTGASVDCMTPEYHDEVFAATSHLPHVLAFALMHLLNEHEELGNVFQYTAGGFRDFTRIASSDATMWRDICLYNRSAIVKWLQNYQSELSSLIELVDQSQGEALFDMFEQAKFARDTHIVKKTDE